MAEAMKQVDIETGEEMPEESREIVAGGTLATISRTEIDMQISTAKRYPRSIATAKRQMLEMATLTKEIAKSCNYALRRTDKGGKIVWIEGPSIRMAEIAVACWGNLRYGARIVDEDGRFITAQGVCHDLEKNVYVTMEVKRRITGRNGNKYSDDMIGMTGNAAAAIAARNAVFKVIPRAIIIEAAEGAMRVAMGEGKEFGAVRAGIVAQFEKMGVKLADLVRILEKTGGGIEDIDSAGLRRLLGLKTAIEDGDTTVEAVFGQADPHAAPKGAAEVLNQIKTAKETAKTVAEEPAPKKSVSEEVSLPTGVGSQQDQPATAEDSQLPAKEDAGEQAEAKGDDSQMSPEEKEKTALKELFDDGPKTYQQAMADAAAKVNPKINAKVIKQAIAKKILETSHGTTFEEFLTYWAKAQAGQIDPLAGKFT